MTQKGGSNIKWNQIFKWPEDCGQMLLYYRSETVISGKVKIQHGAVVRLSQTNKSDVWLPYDLQFEVRLPEDADGNVVYLIGPHMSCGVIARRCGDVWRATQVFVNDGLVTSPLAKFLDQRHAEAQAVRANAAGV